MDFNEVLNQTGVKVTEVFNIGVDRLGNLGINTSDFSTKVLVLLLMSGALYLSFRIGQKAIKVVMVVLLVVFIVSVGYTMF